jgi:hypothetical protein
MPTLQRWCLRVSGLALCWLGVIVMARGVLDCRGGWACAVVALGTILVRVGWSLLRVRQS